MQWKGLVFMMLLMMMVEFQGWVYEPKVQGPRHQRKQQRAPDPALPDSPPKSGQCAQTQVTRNSVLFSFTVGCGE